MFATGTVQNGIDPGGIFHIFEIGLSRNSCIFTVGFKMLIGFRGRDGFMNRSDVSLR